MLVGVLNLNDFVEVEVLILCNIGDDHLFIFNPLFGFKFVKQAEVTQRQEAKD